MKKKILIGLIALVMVFALTGCKITAEWNNEDGTKKYYINGKHVQLDSEDSISKMKYKISKDFDKKTESSKNVYNLYYDENKDKNDVSNLVFSISVTANIMQTESNIESDINKLNNNSSLKNIERDAKRINDITWEVVTMDNYYEEGNDDHFTIHSYYYEKHDGKYYTTYIVSFNKADNIDSLEKEFLNSIVFE